MMELVEFLLARITEDEDAIWQWGTEFPEDGYEKHACDEYGPSLITVGSSRLLAECEAKRRIIAKYRTPDPHRAGDKCRDCGTLYILALPYADHPDFDPEWRI